MSEEIQRKYNLETFTLKAMVARGLSTKRGEDSRGTSKVKSKGRKGNGKLWYCDKSNISRKIVRKKKESKNDAKKEAFTSLFSHVFFSGNLYFLPIYIIL